jgi:hypothetical protein
MKAHTHFEGVNIVGKNNNFVSALLMESYQELAGLEFTWIHAIKQHSLSRLFLQIFAVEFGRHWAPNFSTLSQWSL